MPKLLMDIEQSTGDEDMHLGSQAYKLQLHVVLNGDLTD
jgi:hypothetical protein